MNHSGAATRKFRELSAARIYNGLKASEISVYDVIVRGVGGAYEESFDYGLMIEADT